MQSFSEIDTTSKRASKAAGFSWGIAEISGWPYGASGHKLDQIPSSRSGGSWS